MRLGEIRKELDAELVGLDDFDSVEVNSCYASDLISDVLNFQGVNPLFLTGLTNAQVIQTAEILDVVAICIVRDKEPQAETLKLAEKRKFPLLKTKLTMYEACGRLHGMGLPGTKMVKGAGN